MTGTVALNYEVSGPDDAPVLVLGASIGTDLHMWDAQVAALKDQFRVIAFDNRGHGGSPFVAGPVTMEDLAADVIALADSLGVREFAYAGLSLGGGIGQVLAARYADRVTSLVVCCTSSNFAAAADTWRERAARVRAEGLEWLVESSAQRWFAPGFVEREPETAERMLAMVPMAAPEGYAGCCEALATFDGRELLGTISAPTLVIAGADDVATPVDVNEEIAEAVPGATFLVVPDAAHLAAVEQPETVTEAIRAHVG